MGEYISRAKHYGLVGRLIDPDAIDIRRLSCNPRNDKLKVRSSFYQQEGPTSRQWCLQVARCYPFPTTTPGSYGLGAAPCRGVINGDWATVAITFELEDSEGLRSGFKRVYLVVCGLCFRDPGLPLEFTKGHIML